MDFTITDEQAGLVDSVRDVLERECSPSVVRAAAEGEEDGGELWRAAVDLGWPGVGVPAELGGLGLGALEVVLVTEQLGRAAAPGPTVPTMTQFVPAILEAGDDTQRGRWATAVVGEGLAGTLAVAEQGVWSPDAITAQAKPDGDEWVLEGTKSHVIGAGAADEVVVAARADGDPALFVVPADALAWSPVESLDPTRPVATIPLQGARVGADRRLAHAGGEVVSRVLEAATIGLAAELVGACQAILDMTVAYATVREQFGRRIGSFQAVKHRLADGYVALERARATVYFAAMTLAEDDERRSLAASMAKAAAGDAETLLSGAGIQLHGGIGYTWEHDAHLFVKRAMAAGLLFGNAPVHRDRVADLLDV